MTEFFSNVVSALYATIFVSTLLCLAAASVVCLVGVLSAIWEGLTSISIKRWR